MVLINITNFKQKEILSIILLNLILALPAFYYLFVLEINFLTKTAIIADEKELLFFKKHFKSNINYSNNHFFLFVSSCCFKINRN